MLAEFERQIIDRTWDQIWSSGITNPVVVADLLGSILLLKAADGGSMWGPVEDFARNGDAAEVAAALTAARRLHGIDGGSELEDQDFWQDCTLLCKAMGSLDDLLGTQYESNGADVLGDIYEHVLSKLSTAGHFGQFRTPRHIVQFMVNAIHPKAGERVLDPACGSGGFLVATSQYRHAHKLPGPVSGFELDRTIARIARANIVFHGMHDANIRVSDGLVVGSPDADIILANPPFAGAVSDSVASRFEAGTKKTELLFLESMAKRLALGGRAAVVVPTSVLTGSSRASRYICQLLAAENDLSHVVELPSGVFRPYTDVKTAILFWHRRKPSGPVRMIRIENDGFSLDQRRIPIEENDLEPALELILGESDMFPHVDVSIEELRENRFNLGPSRYLPDNQIQHTQDRRSIQSAFADFGGVLSRLRKLEGHGIAIEEHVSIKMVDRVPLGMLVTPIRLSLKPEQVPPDMQYLGLEHVSSATGEAAGVEAASAQLKSAKFAFEEGDVLYGKLRPTLRKCTVATQPGICSTDLMPLRPVHEDSAYLIAAILRSQKVTADISRLISGANLPRVNVKELMKISIPWPGGDQVKHLNDLARIAHEIRMEISSLSQRAVGLDDALTGVMEVG